MNNESTTDTKGSIEPEIANVSAEKYRFRKVKDGRGRDLEGIWERNGRYYAQLCLPGKNTPRRVPLFTDENLPAKNVTQAKEAYAALLSNRRQGILPGPRITPFFSDYYLHYLSFMEETEAKGPLTIKKERSSLKAWARFLGQTRLNQIERRQINEFVLLRKKEGVTNTVINKDVIALKNLCKFAAGENYLKHGLPTDGWKELEYKAPIRPLWPAEVIDALCNEALRKHKKGFLIHRNGQAFVDWIRLMQWTGARHTAAITCRWSQVDFDKRTITLHTKFDKTVTVDFNPEMEKHLLDMKARKDPNDDCLFPASRNDGDRDHMTHMYKTLNSVKKAVAASKEFKDHTPNVGEFTPHDLRHFFTSWAVMSGIDYRTIAEWRGDADNGVMISSIYSHLDPRHRKAAADKLKFNIPGAQPVQPVAIPVPDKTAVENLSAAELLKLLQEKLGQAAA
ncbi:MAG TPA: site-specific integrase [Verrucomicrobiae bacterium]|nr:site-specific integrase [Verrucomicrobiae bacterium]